VDKQTKIAVILTAYDRMSSVINKSVNSASQKIRSLKKVSEGLDSFGNKALVGGGLTTAYFATTVQAAEENEVAVNRLRQVFKSMGEANEKAALQSEAYASKLEMQIGVEDEAIMAVQAKIATFKTVSNQAARMAGMFDRATKASFDMAATGFGEADQNAVQLGKALEDPIKGITALRRSGITFTESEKAKIKALTESGQKLKAQDMIMRAVEKQVGGVAEKTVTTTQKAKVAWSEVTENIGKTLMPTIALLGSKFVNDVIPKVQAFIEKHPELIEYAAAAGVGLIALGATAKILAFGINGAISVFNGLSTAIKFMGNTLSFVGRLFINNPVLLIIAAVAVSAFLIYKHWGQIKAFFINLWDNVTDTFSRAWSWIKGLFLNYTPAGLVIQHWNKITAWFTGLWDRIKYIFKAAWDGIKYLFLNYTPHGLVIKHWDKIQAWFTALWARLKAIFRAGWDGIKSLLLNYTPHGLVIKHWDKIVAWFANLWNRVKAIFNGFTGWLFGLGTTFLNAGKNIVDSIWKGIKSVAHKPIEAIRGMVSKIRDYLPFSPAKTGALKDIHRIRLVETIAQSIKANPLIKAMGHVTDQVFQYKGQPFTPVPALAGNREPGPVTIHFAPVIHLSGGATAQDANILTTEMRRQFEKLMKDYEAKLKRVKY
jgi:hypothetical protein